jgi:hypothetical protein
MPRVGFVPTIPVFEQAKTFYALDGAAAVIGRKHFFVQRQRIIVTDQLVVA